jgi:caspase 7
MSEEKNYKMDHMRRGVALIINIRKYEDNENEERVWSEKDVKSLKKTFEYLEFDFRLCVNFTAKEISEEIQRQASSDHSNSDCFLCVVMSHGNDEDMFYSSDNKEISFKQLMAPIKLCESLKKKPKLFFFQACRGENKMKQNFAPSPDHNPQTQIQNPEAQSLTCSILFCRMFCCKSVAPKVSPMRSPARAEQPRPLTDHQPQQQMQKETKPEDTNIDSESDLLAFYSTLPDHLSFGTIDGGTFFIQSVCDVLLNEAYKNIPNNDKLSQMILKINNKVKDRGWSLADPINRLTKDVHFLPKDVSESS